MPRWPNASFVVLRGDESRVAVRIFSCSSPHEASAQAEVGQRTRLAHLLEDDGIHPAAEIGVVEGDEGVVVGREGDAQIGALDVVDLLGVVLCQYDPVGGVGCIG